MDRSKSRLQKPRPRYLAVANALAKDIAACRYPVGTMLPTEAALCARYQVSRFTVREAMRHLQARGLVSSRQGQGTRVLSEKDGRQFSTSLHTIADVERHGIYTRMIGIKTFNVEADAGLAEILPCAIGDRFLKIECFREPRDHSVDLPVAWNEIYVIEAYAGVRAVLGERDLHVFTMLEDRFFEKISAIDQDISALIIDGEMATRLQVEPGSAGLRIKRIYTGRGGRPILFGINTYPAERFKFSMRLYDRSIGDIADNT